MLRVLVVGCVGATVEVLVEFRAGAALLTPARAELAEAEVDASGGIVTTAAAGVALLTVLPTVPAATTATVTLGPPRGGGLVDGWVAASAGDSVSLTLLLPESEELDGAAVDEPWAIGFDPLVAP